MMETATSNESGGHRLPRRQVLIEHIDHRQVLRVEHLGQILTIGDQGIGQARQDWIARQRLDRAASILRIDRQEAGDA